jgi:hypothetical protein
MVYSVFLILNFSVIHANSPISQIIEHKTFRDDKYVKQCIMKATELFKITSLSANAVAAH